MTHKSGKSRTRSDSNADNGDDGTHSGKYVQVPMYQVKFTVQNTGRVVAATKKSIKWIFGYSNQETLLTRGCKGEVCRGEEHEVELVWSLTSGKRRIYLDRLEIHCSESSADGGTGPNPAGARFEHVFRMSHGKKHFVRVVAYPSGLLRNKCDPNAVELSFNGFPFHHLPKSTDLQKGILSLYVAVKNNRYQDKSTSKPTRRASMKIVKPDPSDHEPKKEKREKKDREKEEKNVMGAKEIKTVTSSPVPRSLKQHRSNSKQRMECYEGAIAEPESHRAAPAPAPTPHLPKLPNTKPRSFRRDSAPSKRRMSLGAEASRVQEKDADRILECILLSSNSEEMSQITTQDLPDDLLLQPRRLSTYADTHVLQRTARGLLDDDDDDESSKCSGNNDNEELNYLSPNSSDTSRFRKRHSAARRAFVEELKDFDGNGEEEDEEEEETQIFQWKQHASKPICAMSTGSPISITDADGALEQIKSGKIVIRGGFDISNHGNYKGFLDNVQLERS